MERVTNEPTRIISIDALRGFDMLMIIFADRFFFSLNKGVNSPASKFLEDQFQHPYWFGSHFYDIIMPLLPSCFPCTKLCRHCPLIIIRVETVCRYLL